MRPANVFITGVSIKCCTQLETVKSLHVPVESHSYIFIDMNSIALFANFSQTEYKPKMTKYYPLKEHALLSHMEACYISVHVTLSL